MKKQLLLSTVLAAAMATGSAYAAGGGYGKQASDAGVSGSGSASGDVSMERQQTGQMGGSTSAAGEEGYNPSRVGVGGVAADTSMQITNNTDAVRQIQQALQEEGHDIQVDGIWGPNTQQALRDYQEKQGQQATGEPNEETLQALDVDLYQQQPQTAETPSDIGQPDRLGAGDTMGTGSISPGSTGASGAGSMDSPGMGSGSMGSGSTGTGGSSSGQ